jgi:hypothetical protein
VNTEATEEYLVTRWVSGDRGTAKIPVYFMLDGNGYARWVAKHETPGSPSSGTSSNLTF